MLDNLTAFLCKSIITTSSRFLFGLFPSASPQFIVSEPRIPPCVVFLWTLPYRKGTAIVRTLWSACTRPGLSKTAS